MEKDEDCLHCRENKNGVKPYIKMKRIRYTKATNQFLQKLEQEGKNPSCFVCGIVGDFIKGLKSIKGLKT